MVIPIFDVPLSSGLLTTLLIFGIGILIIFALSLSNSLQSARDAARTQPAPAPPAPSDDNLWRRNENPEALGMVDVVQVQRPPDIVLAALLLVVSIVAMAWGANRVITNLRIENEASDSEGWPSVLGSVASVSNIGSGGNYEAGVTYTYEVDGQVYVNDQISYRQQEPYFLTAARFSDYLEANGYVPGRRIRVYYDPAQPQRSTLLHNHDIALNSTLLGVAIVVGGSIAFGFALGALLAAVQYYRSKSREQSTTPTQQPSPMP